MEPDPSAILNSLTGVVAVVMLFAVPIVTTALIAAVILSVAGKRHKERLKMIEQGMIPPPPRKTRGYALLGWGAVSAALGLALLVAQLAARSLDDLAGGFIFLFVGAAMIIVWLIRHNNQRRELVADEPPKSVTQTPPNSLP
jgi:uncharacterized membrane protein HdeD (DUF308 family)